MTMTRERPRDLVDFFIDHDLSEYRRLVLSYLLVAQTDELYSGLNLLDQVATLFQEYEATRADILLMSAYVVAYLTRVGGEPGEISLEDLASFMESLEE